MSVLMVLKIPVDEAGMEQAAREHGDHMKGIAQRGRDRGAIHHAFYSGNGEMIVVDEWESEEAFNGFFEAEAENIGQLMAAAGATGEPGPPTFYKKLSFGDEF